MNSLLVLVLTFFTLIQTATAHADSAYVCVNPVLDRSFVFESGVDLEKFQRGSDYSESRRLEGVSVRFDQPEPELADAETLTGTVDVERNLDDPLRPLKVRVRLFNPAFMARPELKSRLVPAFPEVYRAGVLVEFEIIGDYQRLTGPGLDKSQGHASYWKEIVCRRRDGSVN